MADSNSPRSPVAGQPEGSAPVDRPNLSDIWRRITQVPNRC